MVKLNLRLGRLVLSHHARVLRSAWLRCDSSRQIPHKTAELAAHELYCFGSQVEIRMNQIRSATGDAALGAQDSAASRTHPTQNEKSFD